MPYSSENHGQYGALDILLPVHQQINLLFVYLIKIYKCCRCVFTLHPNILALENARVPLFYCLVDLAMTDDSIELIDVFLLTLHLNLLNGQFPLDLDFVVEFVFEVFVCFESVEVDLGYWIITMSILGDSLRYLVC